MYQHSISFVIPAYNEQDNIKKIADSAFNFLVNNFKDFEIIIVDDGSRDNTQEICHELMLKYKDRLFVLRHAANRGYGAALRTGLFSSKKDLVFYTDADSQFDVNEIGNFMKSIDNHDIVIGYRMNRKDNFLRKSCAYIYNRLIFVLFGLDVKDIDCSFKLFKKSSLRLLSIDTDEFFVDTELLLKSKLQNFKIKEIGVTHLPRIAGKSSVKIRHVFSTIRDIIFLYHKLRPNK